MRILIFNAKVIVSLLITGFIFTGCDAWVLYRFKVVNATQSTVTVFSITSHTTDTTFILPGNQAIIYERQQTNSSVKPYFNDELIWWFLKLEAVKENSIYSNKDLKEVRWWRFYKEGKQGVYELELKESDF